MKASKSFNFQKTGRQAHHHHHEEVRSPAALPEAGKPRLGCGWGGISSKLFAKTPDNASQ